MNTLIESKKPPYNQFIIVIQQCPTGLQWHSPEVMQALNVLLSEISNSDEVDKKWIFLTGFSMGGIGVMELAMKYPDHFSAIAPVCGRCENIGNISKIVNKEVPVWITYAKHDEKKNLTEGSKELILKLKDTKRFHEPTVLDHNLEKSKKNPDSPVNHIEARRVFSEPHLYNWFLSISQQKEST